MFVRFDVPVIGVETTRLAAEVKLRVIVTEGGRTLLLEAMRLSILPIVQRFQLLFASCNRQSKIYNLRFFRGVLAQLVERLNGIEEVRGSNPLGSKFPGTNLEHLAGCTNLATKRHL